MITFNWTSKFQWAFYPHIYQSYIGWCFEIKWLWFQFCIYNTRATYYLTKIMNKGIEQWQGVRATLITREELDAEVDTILEKET